MILTEQEAVDAIHDHHRALDAEVAGRAAAVVAAAHDARPVAGALADLLGYLADEVLPHALAEEETIYAAAGASVELAPLVAEMTEEHRGLIAATERLAEEQSDVEIAGVAEAIATTFSEHVAKENDVLLPRLLAEGSVDLGALLGRMHERFAAARAGAVRDSGGPDPQAALVALVLRAADELCDADRAERACQLAASAWVALRRARPDLAVRLTAALHRLARLAGATMSAADTDTSVRSGQAEPLLDVRSLAPAQRHEEIFATYERLGPGEGFLLVNDHDPKPLRYQLEAEHPGAFTWSTHDAGPKVWRVRIGRPPAAGSGELAGEESPELDLRSLPHVQRHDVVVATLEAMVPGRSLLLVDDHDPRPFRLQPHARRDGVYSWHYVEAGPRVWRVLIARTA